MAYNYIEIIGDCFPNSEAVVGVGKNPEIYSDLTWITTPISQAVLEASNCANATSTVDSAGEPVEGDILVWNGTAWGTLSYADTNPVFHVTFTNESTTKNRWLDYMEDKSSDEIPFVVPFNVKMVAITFSNEVDDADTDVMVYHAAKDQGSTTTVKETWQVRSVRVAGKTIISPEINLSAGDKIAVYLKNAGTSPKSPTIVLYFQKIDTISADFSESFSGDF